MIHFEFIITENAITEVADTDLFYRVVDYLESKNIKFTEKLDGFEVKYFDFIYKNNISTLHLHDWVGISLYSEELNKDELEPLYTEIMKFIKETYYKNPKRWWQFWKK